MDTRYEIPPRLRLNRQASSFAATVDDSNFHTTFNYEREHDASDEGDDDGSTPRLGMTKMSVDSFDEPLHFSAQAQAQSTPAPPREATPAERLRAVLSRASSLTPTVRTQNVPLERTPSTTAALLESDVESEDFETPRQAANGVHATPFSQNSTTSSVNQSVARESVRNIFARALRSPGNTPERSRRPRRGSVDSSIVEESPIKWSMLKPGERMKRLSLSDDEKERIKATRSGLADESIESFTSSQAAIYDQLRQRLEGTARYSSVSKGKTIAKSDMTIDMEEATEVEEQLLKDRKGPIRSSTSPVASNVSMAQQSMFQFPSQFLGSNLLTENSDMRRMVEEAQIETTDSEAPGSKYNDKTPIAGPSADRRKPRLSLVHERTLSRNGSVGSLSSSSSRPTSRQSMNGFEDEDRKRERERGWNHPLGPYMERHRETSPLHPITQSGGFGRIRKVSLGSISGSESDVGRASPMSSAKRQNNQPVDAKYGAITSSHIPSSSPNQIRVSARIRTVSQPAKPSSPRNAPNSTKSDGTQRPLDRPRTVSLTARDTPRPSSSHALVRSSSAQDNKHVVNTEESNRSASPSSSRSFSSRASHQSEGPRGAEQPHVLERNRNSPRPKRTSPSLMSEKRRTGNAAHTTTTPAGHTSRLKTPYATSSSPSSIPKLSVNGRPNPVRHAETNKGGEEIKHRPRNLSASTSIPVNTLANGTHTSSSQARDTMRHDNKELEHKAFSRREHDHGYSSVAAPTPALEMNGSDESEEHDTPKISQQRIPDLPTESGSKPSSRIGASSGFSLHHASNGNDRVKASATASPSMTEKERYQKDDEHMRNTQPLKISVPSEPIDLHDSDLDSFQEEEIAASSSAPRLSYGDNSLDESDASSRAEERRADIIALKPRQNLRLNVHTEELPGKKSTLPANFSPPLSPSQPDAVTSTPQRQKSANISKMEFRTPTPPKGMPPLPDPPSSEEDIGGDKTPPTPVTPANRHRYTDVKTPRFPGAWTTPFATTHRSTLPKKNHTEEKQAAIQNEMYTPPASYSRATSMIMKTPAPPGAWLSTPGTVAAKRLQQKVRFDEQETATSARPVPAADDGTLTSEVSTTDGSVTMKTAGKAKTTSPRTPGRIRVVDAFGNEITPFNGVNRTDTHPLEKVDELHATEKDEKSTSSESKKTRIRVLDSMGREINGFQMNRPAPTSLADIRVKQSTEDTDENVPVLFQESNGKKLERRQALQLLQRTIAELKDDFNETDDPARTQTADCIDAQIAKLKAQSIRAKEDRERLLQKIKDAKMGQRPSRLMSAWNTLFYGKNIISTSNRGVYFKAFVVLTCLQVLVFFAFYRLSTLGARQLFLTTYIDPFYPELYLHITNPDHLHVPTPPRARSGLYAIISSSWLHPIIVCWHAVMDWFSILKDNVWDIWRDPPQGMAWPPT